MDADSILAAVDRAVGGESAGQPNPPDKPGESPRSKSSAEQSLAALRQTVANGVELAAARVEARAIRRPDHVDLQPPRDHHDPDSGRRELAPQPELVEFGRYLRRARRYAQLSQQHVADAAGVSQSTVSRLERGVAPHVGVDKLLAIRRTYGRLLPLGVCPHEHECAWQPVRPPAEKWRGAAFVELILAGSDPPEEVDQPASSHTED